MDIRNYKSGDLKDLEFNKYAPSVSVDILEGDLKQQTHAVIISWHGADLAIICAKVKNSEAVVKALLTKEAELFIITLVKKVKEFMDVYMALQEVKTLIAYDVHTKDQHRWMTLIGFKKHTANTYIRESCDAFRKSR